MKWSEIFNKQEKLAGRLGQKFDLALAKSYEACLKRMEDYQKKPLEKSYEAQWGADGDIYREEISFRSHETLGNLYYVESTVSLITDIVGDPRIESRKSSLLANYHGSIGRLDSKEDFLKWYVLPDMDSLLHQNRIYHAIETEIKEETT